ncbi:MAG: TonB-dependent receptor [Bacteroidota bacterium]|nr:TonB-dependent receptor [Bacteroidota bacterium]
MKRTLLLLIFIAITIVSNASTIKLAGRVIDQINHSPLIGVAIFKNDQLSCLSNDNGYFELSMDGQQSIKIVLKYLGYKTKEVTLNPNYKESELWTIELEESHLDLPLIEVGDRTGLEQNYLKTIDLKTRPINNTQELLKFVPGLFLAQHAGGGKAEQIFLRGYDIDHGTDIQIAVDGMPVNMVSHTHGQGYADMHFIIPESIEGINYRKGPFEAQDGNFATAAFVQVNTLHALKQNFVKAELGQHEYSRVVAGINLGNIKNEHTHNHAYIMGEGIYSNGYFNAPQNFYRFNILGKYNYLINDRQSIEWSLSQFNSKWKASGQIPQRAVTSGLIPRFGAIDATEGGNTSRTNLNLIYFLQTKNSGLFKNQFYYTHYNFNLFSNFTFYLNNPEHGDQIQQTEKRSILGFLSSWQKDIQYWNSKFTVDAAMGLRSDKVPQSVLANTVDRDIIMNQLSNGSIQEHNLYSYVNFLFNIHPKIQIKPAIRLDLIQFNYKDNLVTQPHYTAAWKYALTPKLILRYTPVSQIEFFIKAGTGFHSNDSRLSSNDLSSKKLSYVKAIDFSFNHKLFSRFLYGATLWYMDTQDELVYVGDEGIVEVNDGGVRKGAELFIRMQILERLFFDGELNYTYARYKHKEPEANFIPLAPIWISTAGLSYNPGQSGWFGSLRQRYCAGRPLNEANSLSAISSFIVDAQLGYRKKQWEAALTIENLLDETWNEAQFETESRLKDEAESVTELHFTPGKPFSGKLAFSYYF